MHMCADKLISEVQLHIYILHTMQNYNTVGAHNNIIINARISYNLLLLLSLTVRTMIITKLMIMKQINM
jgi:hypothetical protein